MRLTDADLAAYEARYVAAGADVREVQARVLAAILAAARGSAFVRAHRLAAASVDDFRARVPIQGHEEHAPYIARMMAGEPDQLFAGGAIAFLETSGTTAGAKYFPVRELAPDERTAIRIDEDFETALFLRAHPELSFRGHHLHDDCGLWLNLVAAPPARSRNLVFE